MHRKDIYLAGGNFWGMQKYFDSVKGVLRTQVGYANGCTPNPTYADVSRGNSGYTETVRVQYDPNGINLRDLLVLFFRAIDPTSVDKQGKDIGNQYRTGVYYVDEEDRKTILDFMAEEQKRHAGKIVTEAKELESYYPAEEYHQEYLEKNPEGYCSIGKIELGYARNYNV